MTVVVAGVAVSALSAVASAVLGFYKAGRARQLAERQRGGGTPSAGIRTTSQVPHNLVRR